MVVAMDGIVAAGEVGRAAAALVLALEVAVALAVVVALALEVAVLEAVVVAGERVAQADFQVEAVAPPVEEELPAVGKLMRFRTF
jgi:hypothetical protein